MKNTFIMKIVYLSFIIIVLISTLAIAQKNGTKNAEFLSEKVIITEEISTHGESESQKKEIEAPKGYTAIRGDGFTDTFPLIRYDRNGAKEQTFPVINLSYNALHHYLVTYVGKDTIELPDQVIAITDHFTVYVKETSEPEDKFDVWIDDRGFLVLYSTISAKDGAWVAYQEAYDKDKNKGIIRALLNGQYFGYTEWAVVDSSKDFFMLKLQTLASKKMGGFKMSVEYSLDKDFNPRSYIESLNIPGK